MRAVLLLGITLSPLVAHPANQLLPQQILGGWVLLFNGTSLSGWTPVGETDWRVADGTLIGEGKGTGWLRTNAPFHDYILNCDFRTSDGGTSGIGVRGATYRLPSGKTLEEKRWHRYVVMKSAGGFFVWLDERRIVAGTEDPTAAGPIGLAHQGGKVEYRNILLKPLNLTPLYDRRTLSGWRIVGVPGASRTASWGGSTGVIRGDTGPGQLETRERFDDFVLQMQIHVVDAAAGRQPEDGFFIRGEPGQDRTGTLVAVPARPPSREHVQPARSAATPGINEFCTMTVLAHGSSVNVWVNGTQVSGLVRSGQSTAASGTISLQAPRPGAALEVRSVRIARLPPVPSGRP